MLTLRKFTKIQFIHNKILIKFENLTTKIEEKLSIAEKVKLKKEKKEQKRLERIASQQKNLDANKVNYSFKN